MYIQIYILCQLLLEKVMEHISSVYIFSLLNFMTLRNGKVRDI